MCPLPSPAEESMHVVSCLCQGYGVLEPVECLQPVDMVGLMSLDCHILFLGKNFFSHSRLICTNRRTDPRENASVLYTH